MGSRTIACLLGLAAAACSKPSVDVVDVWDENAAQAKIEQRTAALRETMQTLRAGPDDPGTQARAFDSTTAARKQESALEFRARVEELDRRLQVARAQPSQQ